MTPAPTRRIRYADVAATLALALAVSASGAYAAGKIGSGDIAKNAVKSKHLARGAVKSADLKDGAVTGAKVKDGSLAGGDLASRVPGVALAGVTVATSGSALRSFNRLGGPVTATRPDTGEYEVTIPGASFDGYYSALASISPSLGIYCFVQNAEGPTLDVDCLSFTGEPANTPFSLVLFGDKTGGILNP